MNASVITQLIINSSYEGPARYWRDERETRLFSLEDGRRPAVGVGEDPSRLSLEQRPGAQI